MKPYVRSIVDDLIEEKIEIIGGVYIKGVRCSGKIRTAKDWWICKTLPWSKRSWVWPCNPPS